MTARRTFSLPNFSKFKAVFPPSFWNVREKTVYDWLMLAGTAFIPIVLGVSTNQANQLAQDRADAQKESAADSANLARQHEVMTNYLSRMTTLMLDKQLRTSNPKSDVRVVARAITLNAARRLENDYKGQLLKFLYEAELIGYCPIDSSKLQAGECKDEILVLRGAKLEGITLKDSRMPTLGGINLEGSVLKEAKLPKISLPKASLKQANMEDATLVEAFLVGAEMEGANLDGIHLEKAWLSGAILAGASMTSAHLQCTQLDGANLVGSNLQGADLSNADLSGAVLGRNTASNDYTNLANADLRGAVLKNTDLSVAVLDGADLTGATYNKYTNLPPGRTGESYGMRLETDANASQVRSQECNKLDLTKYLE